MNLRIGLPFRESSHSQKTIRTASLILLLTLVAAMLLVWMMAVPVFEAPDEPDHLSYAVYLGQNGDLPPYNATYVEANQPPLYYLMMAPIAKPSIHPRKVVWTDSNGVTHFPGVNFFEHSTTDFVQYGSIYIVRLVTSLLSVFTVFVCYLIGKEVSGDHRTGLLIGGLVGFLPQFLFRGMNISNDALVTLSGALATFWIIRLARRGFNWRAGLHTAFALALAVLSKVSAIVMLVPVTLTILSSKSSWRVRVSRLSLLAVTFLLLTPWFLSNVMRYGDFLGVGIINSIVPQIVVYKPITSPYFLDPFPRLLFQSFVGYFGWMNLPLPNRIYLMFALLGLFALVGYAWRLWRKRIDLWFTLVLLSIPFLAFVSTVYLNLSFNQPQGRYMFSALPAIATLVALGLEGLPKWSGYTTLAVLAGLFAMNVLILSTIVIPVYW